MRFHKILFLMINFVGSLTTCKEIADMAFGGLHFQEMDIESLDQHIRKAIELNITTLDLADVYGWYTDGRGKSIDLLSQVFAMDHSLKESLTLICKFGIRLENGYHVDTSRAWIMESADRYLELLGLEKIDIFMIHNPHENMDINEISKTFFDLYQQGKVDRFGVSNFEYKDFIRLDSAMKQFNLTIDVYEIEASILYPEKIKDLYQYRNVSIVLWSPCGGDPNGGKNRLFYGNDKRARYLVEKLQSFGNVDNIAIQWLLKQKIGVPILGTTQQDRLEKQGYNSLHSVMSDELFDTVSTIVYSDNSY